MTQMKRETRISRRETLQQGAFTLIEMLVVIAIIVILVGSVVAIGNNIRANSQIRQTKLTLQLLDQAAEAYRMSNGGVEPGPSGTAVIVSNSDFGFRSSPEAMRILQKLPPAVWSGSSAFYDAWGNAIQYVQAGYTTAILRGYFQSAGPDGQMGTPASPNADDIFSYDR